MGGVKGTRYLLPIDFCNIRTQKCQNVQKVIKNNFRILKEPHAYLQTILKAPVKFQKDRTKTVGGVKGTRYLLKIRNHAPRTTESRKQCPSAFLRKSGGQKKQEVSVVQSLVSLTNSLRVISLTFLADSIHNILIRFAKKVCVAFALQKLLTFFQQKISAYLRITRCKF